MVQIILNYNNRSRNTRTIVENDRSGSYFIETRCTLWCNDSADDELFHSILYNPHHVLHSTLPKATGSSYELRRRRHNRELLNKSSRLVQSCFLVRMLYKDIYWLFRLTSFYNHIIFTLYTLRFIKVLLIDWLILIVSWLLCAPDVFHRSFVILGAVLGWGQGNPGPPSFHPDPPVLVLFTLPVSGWCPHATPAPVATARDELSANAKQVAPWHPELCPRL